MLYPLKPASSRLVYFPLEKDLAERTCAQIDRMFAGRIKSIFSQVESGRTRAPLLLSRPRNLYRERHGSVLIPLLH